MYRNGSHKYIKVYSMVHQPVLTFWRKHIGFHHTCAWGRQVLIDNSRASVVCRARFCRCCPTRISRRSRPLYPFRDLSRIRRPSFIVSIICSNERSKLTFSSITTVLIEQWFISLVTWNIMQIIYELYETYHYFILSYVSSLSVNRWWE